MRVCRAVLGGSGLLLAGFLFTQCVLADPLPNAWQITDNSTTSTLHYTANLSATNRYAATNSGFTFTLNARFVDNFGGFKAMTMIYGLGNRRFLVWWNLNANNELTAELEGGGTYTLTTNGTGYALYHTHEIIYDPVTSTASYRVDGQQLTNHWPGSATALLAGQVYWGAGSSAGRGQMNFHSVSFAINGLGNVLSYDAGTENNPTNAPDPAAAGWVLSAVPQPPDTSTNALSPDTAFGLLPVPQTGWADGFTANSAVLYGRVVQSKVSSAMAWLEWGTDTNYGNATPPQAVGAGQSFVTVSNTINPLVAGVFYHYRVVASNAFGLVSGSDLYFNLDFLQMLPQVKGGSMAWGDYDNDGNLDFLVTGLDYRTNRSWVAPISELWRNNGNGTFSNVTATATPGLPSLVGAQGEVTGSSVAWGDYDNDGHLDFLITGLNDGISYAAISQLWHNNGNGTFSNVTATAAPGLEGIFYGSVAWGDYDNDGRLDFLITGAPNRGSFYSISQIWRNMGDGTFANVTATAAPGLPGLYRSVAAWGDFNNDGYLDFLIAGQDGSLTPHTLIWHNDGSGSGALSTMLTNLAFAAYLPTSATVGDFDNDGFLDLLLQAANPVGPPYLPSPYGTTIWFNRQDDTFNTWPLPFQISPTYSERVNLGLVYGSTTLGDCDNDGKLDILVSGSEFRGVARVYAFVVGYLPGWSDIQQLPGIGDGVNRFGDYDNDGRLDIFLSGRTTNGVTSLLWHNDLPASNAPPAAPAGLAASGSAKVVLTWNPATDDHTPPAGLGYNVRVGTAPGGGDVVSPMARADGLRLLPQLGNAQMRTNFILNLPPGTYYWSVQAIDTAFVGGAFASEQSFVVPGPTLSIVASNQSMIISWQPNTPGFRLQQTFSLFPANWTNSPSTTTNPVVVPEAEATKFFRLIRTPPS